MRFENFITFNEPELWYSIIEGPYMPESIPTNDRAQYANKPIPLRGVEMTAEEKKMVKMDLRAYASLTLALPMEVLMCVKDYKTAKSLWDHLEIMFAGNNEIKKMKKDTLKYQFETFKHSQGETVTQQIQRFVQLVNELKTYEIKIDTYDLNKKLLHNLPESWKHNVSLIKNTKDIEMVKVDDIIAKVESMAMDERTRNNSSLN